jgi:3-oxoadipate enol-lactonase
VPSTQSTPRLAFVREGRRDGQPVVFSHAIGCRMEMWDAIVPMLSRTHEIVRYDTRCHGASEVVPSPFSMDALVADAVRVLDEADLESVSWVGLSMGGMIGQGLAIAHPGRVRKLILANTTSRYAGEAKGLWLDRARIARSAGMGALADLIMSRYFSPAFLASHAADVERFRRIVLETDARGYAACCEAIGDLDYLQALPRIACPTLVIAGEADPATPPAVAREIADRIPGARLEVIERAGHLSAVEQPGEFARLVREFVG